MLQYKIQNFFKNQGKETAEVNLAKLIFLILDTSYTRKPIGYKGNP